MIALVKVVSIEASNNRCALANIDVIKTFKGDRRIEKIILPNNIDCDKEYLLFLKYTDDGVELAARKGAIFSEGEDLWSEFVSAK